MQMVNIFLQRTYLRSRDNFSRIVIIKGNIHNKNQLFIGV